MSHPAFCLVTPIPTSPRDGEDSYLAEVRGIMNMVFNRYEQAQLVCDEGAMRAQCLAYGHLVAMIGYHLLGEP